MNKERKEFPKRIRVRLNNIAKENGNYEEMNMIIEVVEGENDVLYSYPFSRELLKAIKDSEELPVEFIGVEDDFEFIDVDLNKLIYKK